MQPIDRRDRAWSDFYDRTQRFAFGPSHRRAGTTTELLKDLVRRATKPGGIYAYIAPLGRGVPEPNPLRNEVWMQLLQTEIDLGTEPTGIESHFMNSLRVGRTNILVLNAGHPTELRGRPFDGVACDFFGDWSNHLWSALIHPALLDTGGWASMAGAYYRNPEYLRLKTLASKPESGWFYQELKASTTKIIDPLHLADYRRTVGEQTYASEMACAAPQQTESKGGGSVRNSVFEALLRGYEPVLVNRSA